MSLLLSSSDFRRKTLSPEPGTGDDVTRILIFGVTGMTGGAVMEAALGCAWFRVTGFTRATSGELYDELVSKGVKVASGDMNMPHTLQGAMKDIDTVFLTTTYWDSMNVEREYKQGVNVVNTAIENSVKHLIYAGTDYHVMTAKDRCKYLEGKARVEDYLVSVGMPFTVVHLGFFFENLLSVFKPHKTGKNEFAIALPMGHVGLNCGSVLDFGHCIGRIALRPDTYLFRTIKLATTYMTVTDMAQKCQHCYPTYTFYNPTIPLKEYKRFDFEGAEELASMFAHYRTLKEWDRALVSELNPCTRSFEQWLKDSEKAFLDVLGDHENVEVIELKYRLFRVVPFGSFFGYSFSMSGKTTGPSIASQETERHLQRRIAIAEARLPLDPSAPPADDSDECDDYDKELDRTL